MDLAPFLAALEKLGMFGIAGYLVWHMVKNNESLISQIKEIVAVWSTNSQKTLDVLNKIDTKLDRVASDMERNDAERTELLKALANIRSKQGGFTSISLSIIVGLVLLATLLGWHSSILTRDLKTAVKERDEYSAKVEAASTHEKELQAALVTGEQTLRNYIAQHEQAVKELRNAKPNNCTDAPVSPDIDRILRGATANLGYMHDTGISIVAAPNSRMGRQDKPGFGGVLLASKARCFSV